MEDLLETIKEALSPWHWLFLATVLLGTAITAASPAERVIPSFLAGACARSWIKGVWGK